MMIGESLALYMALNMLICHSDIILQAWCMLLNDKVAFRMQWPQYADLQVNGMVILIV